MNILFCFIFGCFGDEIHLREFIRLARGDDLVDLIE
jgi:hypothetical protein